MISGLENVDKFLGRLQFAKVAADFGVVAAQGVVGVSGATRLLLPGVNPSEVLFLSAELLPASSPLDVAAF